MADKKETVGLVALKDALSTQSVKERFEQMLGKKSAGFISNIMSVAQNNAMFQKVERSSVILAAAQAASLDLSINPNLGLAALIPYGNICQFQVQRDGWVELCLRTGQFEYIVNEIVYEGELVKRDRFTDTYIFDETKRKSDKPIGYMAAFKLIDGYRKTVYWTFEECKAHGLKYSQTFKKGKGLWVDNFHAMALKSVLKHLLKKYAPKSIEIINKAMEVDQAAFTGSIDNPQPVYVDNDNNAGEKTMATEEFQEAEVVASKQPTSHAAPAAEAPAAGEVHEEYKI
jgi:recombination protein RecT